MYMHFPWVSNIPLILYLSIHFSVALNINWVKLELILISILALNAQDTWKNGVKRSQWSLTGMGFFSHAAWKQMWVNHAVIYGKVMTTIIFTTSDVLLSRFCPKWGSWKSYKTVKHTLIYAEFLFYPLLAMCVAIEVCVGFCVFSCVCVKQPPPQIC